MATSKTTVAGTTLSSTEFQREIKESVMPIIMDGGISNMEITQIDSYKYILHTRVQGVECFAELSVTAKKADYTLEDVQLAAEKFAEKQAKAVEREADRIAKRAEKANVAPRNSSGNLSQSSVVNGEYVPYTERYTSEDF